MAHEALAESYPFVARLGEEAREEFLGGLLLRDVPARTPLVRCGEEVSGVYLVERGALRVHYVDREGREGTLYWVEPGESCVLAINAVFNRVRYPAWVESDAEPTRFAVAPAALFRRLFERESALREFTFASLSSRVFELMTLVEETATFSREQRLARLLLRLAEGGEVEATQEVLAGHLGTAREVVSRILRGLAARRLVRTSRGVVQLLDRGALAQLVRGE